MTLKLFGGISGICVLIYIFALDFKGGGDEF